MEEYRIDIKVRNNLILEKIESMGYQSALSFCKDKKICYRSFVKFLNMKEPIFDKQGRIRIVITKLCETLNCIPEEIFSANQMEASLKDNKRTLKIQEAEAMFLLQQNNNQKLLEDQYSEEQMFNKIDNVLDTITARERKVLEMRMGLGKYDREHTLEEIGKIFDVKRERVRQIEQRALRKIRHPSRSANLRDY